MRINLSESVGVKRQPKSFGSHDFAVVAAAAAVAVEDDDERNDMGWMNVEKIISYFFLDRQYLCISRVQSMCVSVQYSTREVKRQRWC